MERRWRGGAGGCCQGKNPAGNERLRLEVTGGGGFPEFQEGLPASSLRGLTTPSLWLRFLCKRRAAPHHALGGLPALTLVGWMAIQDRGFETAAHSCLLITDYNPDEGRPGCPGLLNRHLPIGQQPGRQRVTRVPVCVWGGFFWLLPPVLHLRYRPSPPFAESLGEIQRWVVQIGLTMGVWNWNA